MNIMAVKIASGEEIVAEVIEQLDGSIQCRRPRVVQMMQTQQGVGAGLVPYIMSAPDATIPINPDCIVAKVKVGSQIERAYTQEVSGLDLTTKF